VLLTSTTLGYFWLATTKIETFPPAGIGFNDGAVAHATSRIGRRKTEAMRVDNFDYLLTEFSPSGGQGKAIAKNTTMKSWSLGNPGKGISFRSQKWSLPTALQPIPAPLNINFVGFPELKGTLT
jgi:hypothetical protein